MQRTLTWGLLMIFLASGVAKLAGLGFEQAAFARWGYPLWFMYAVGAAETLGALGLLSRLRRWAAGRAAAADAGCPADPFAFW
ncbi:DoxX family protein [Edwardsiella ictaluri]|nr:DoxX family protein [Edwardsiella ictaluri]WFO09863.1 DoxX family protein [Edwardsiella ictaluri]